VEADFPFWLPTLSQHLLVTVLALLVYVLTTRVGRSRRPPTSAIAWVIGLGLMPYLSLPLFLMFGTRKLRAARGPRAIKARPERPWAEDLLESLGAGAPAPARVRFHDDGAQARDALWSVIDSATRTLDVSTFLVGDDAIGRETVARLTARAREGVQVRLLVDAIGIWLKRPPSLRVLRDAGASVVWFNPLLRLDRRIPRNLRNHRKLAIADDRRLWSGGRNLADEYFIGEGGAPPWIDLSFEIEGAVAASAARQFEIDWRAARGLPRRIVVEPESDGAGPVAQFVPSGPDQLEDTVHTLLLAACFHAKRRVLAVTPYFVPDEDLLQAMRFAVLRGVEFTLVLPRRSNHRIADFVRGRALRLLAESGARVHLLPQMLHAKAMVIDESLAWSGSVNLDSRSLLINYESISVFYGDAEVRWLATWIETHAARGERFEPRRAGILRDLAEGLLLMIAFQV
jgi:cardiolipin synthase A/B